VVLSAGAAGVMMGIREETEDLDADVLPNVFNWAALTKKLVIEKGISDRIAFSEKVDLHILDEDRGVVCIEGVWVYSPRELLNQKRALSSLSSRPMGKLVQDQVEITLLEELVKAPKFTARAV
jgi:hypothetical protein